MFGVKGINGVRRVFGRKVRKPPFVRRTMLMAEEKIAFWYTVNVKILVLLLLSFEFGCRTSRLDKIDMSRLRKAS